MVSNKQSIITCGVTQGLILGSLLFLIYLSNMHWASACINLIIFADDTNLFLFRWKYDDEF